MPQQTKIFRVFVSSTFTDMKVERRLLQKNVFPKLEKFCEEKGAKFQAVDLRWGVNEEPQLNQKTLDICLNEISRCQRISPKPNFLILLGDKYGWQPIPTKIPEEEMFQIFSVITDEDKVLIEQWYKLDENAVPAEYVLQSRENEFADYKKWEKVEVELKNILRHSVSKRSFSDEQKVKYFTSATHQEIKHGALNPPPGTENPEEHVFAFIRETKGLPNDQTAEGFIDLIYGQPDEYSKKQLNDLKEELERKLGDNCITYGAEWEDGINNIDNTIDFEDKVYNFLKDIIEQQISALITPDEIEHEKRLHKEFKEKLTEHFCGRDEILSKIDNYLSDKTESKTMAIIGASGSGKSSVLAEAVWRYEKENSNAKIVYRFIGTTSASSNIISLLQSVCGEIAKEFDTTFEALIGEGREKSLYDINGMTEVFRKCLVLSTEEKPIIVFLDALDQLSDTENAKALYWLPKEIPENSKLIISALPELESNLSETYIEHLKVLPEKEAQQILDKWFLSINRKLTSAQHQEVLQKFNKSGLAIYLKLAFEMAKHWHSYDDDYFLHDEVKGVINDFFDELGKEHDKNLVEHAVCYMLSGRYQGLTEKEILEILAFDDEFWEYFLEKICHADHKAEILEMKEAIEGKKKDDAETEGEKEENGKQKQKGFMKIPIVLWSRLYLDLEPFLTERDADGVPIITFFHRQFNEVLKERYNLDALDGDKE